MGRGWALAWIKATRRWSVDGAWMGGGRRRWIVDVAWMGRRIWADGVDGAWMDWRTAHLWTWIDRGWGVDGKGQKTKYVSHMSFGSIWWIGPVSTILALPQDGGKNLEC